MRAFAASSVLGRSARLGPSLRTPRVRSLHQAVRCAAEQSQGENFTITTPLYYVNAGVRAELAACGEFVDWSAAAISAVSSHFCATLSPCAAPHMGSAYSTIAADTAARFQVCGCRATPVRAALSTSQFVNSPYIISCRNLVLTTGSFHACRD